MIVKYTTQFKKDYKRLKKQNKDFEKLRVLIEVLISGENLDPMYKDHQLRGELNDYRDCHIEPDWILIYKRTPEMLILERTGSHSELFK